MGDGSTVHLTRDENEVDYLVDMLCCPSRVWGVQRTPTSSARASMLTMTTEEQRKVIKMIKMVALLGV